MPRDALDVDVVFQKGAYFASRNDFKSKVQTLDEVTNRRTRWTGQVQRLAGAAWSGDVLTTKIASTAWLPTSPSEVSAMG